jgi:hypothetical protein
MAEVHRLDQRAPCPALLTRDSRQAAPLTVQAGAVIFGDPGTSFAGSIALLLDTVARLRSP